MHVVGARPNFMKAAPVMNALRERGVNQRLVHTGQHYDDALSDVFFRELALPEPDVHLGVGSRGRSEQIAELLVTLESVYASARPALVVVYGDVTSTMAASVTAAILHIPTAHVEAGLRSFDMSMPEEMNRRIADLLGDLLFATSPDAVDNLTGEGASTGRVHFVGNPMIDTLLGNLHRLDPAAARARFGLAERYGVATFHRPSNVDGEKDASALVGVLRAVTGQLPIVLPLHPRGRATLEKAGILGVPNLHVIDPIGYIEFLSLVKGAALVITDSGGIQEETTVLGIPCLTLRPNTERPITISHGTNRLVSVEGLPAATRDALSSDRTQPNAVPPLWDGHAGERIADVMVDWLAGR